MLVVGLTFLSQTEVAPAATTPSCVHTAGPDNHGTATRPGAMRVLVPPGADELLVCRYSGSTTTTVKTEGSTGVGVLDSGFTANPTQIAKIIRSLDAIPVSRHVACPMYLMAGSEAATFYYRSGPSVKLTVQLGGCSALSNGHVTRLGLSSPGLQALQALLHPTG